MSSTRSISVLPLRISHLDIVVTVKGSYCLALAYAHQIHKPITMYEREKIFNAEKNESVVRVDQDNLSIYADVCPYERDEYIYIYIYTC